MHMSIAPFSPHPAPAAPGTQGGSWRTRLAVASASVGIGATLLAYAISPGLRHAVSHAEHSVGHAVSRVFDRDAAAHKRAVKAKARKPLARPAGGAHTATKHSSASTHTSSTRY
jgi:hypothetical protein